MIFPVIIHPLIKTKAALLMAVRGGVVGVNFGLMIGVAAVLGFDDFGRLMVWWGMSLVTATVISGGAPLVLLRGLTDGAGMTVYGVCTQAIVLPVLIAGLAVCLLPMIWPTVPWFAIVLLGFAVHLTSCLASVMRALGSLQWSMVLRDAVPQAGLACVVFIEGMSVQVLLWTAGGLGVVSCVVMLWCWRHSDYTRILHPCGVPPSVSFSLWGTSLLGVLLSQIDIIVGGWLLSAGDMGLYAVLRRIANLVALPVSVATWINAPRVSAAGAAYDTVTLQRNSDHGNRIALIPAVILALLLLVAMPVAVAWADIAWRVDVFVVLLLAVFTQVIFASSFTVATLCGFAYFAAVARLVSVGAYLFLVMLWGARVAPLSHACIYGCALGFGHLALWHYLRRVRGVDTSVFALMAGGGWRWRLS